MQPSDSSPLPRQLCLLGFLPWPGTALAIAGETRSPRFRRDPFARDVFSDPGRVNDASHNGIAHVAFDSFHGLRPCGKPISWLNSTPHAIAVYASRASSPALMQHSLPGGLLRPYPNRSSTGWITPASPGARKARLPASNGKATWKPMLTQLSAMFLSLILTTTWCSMCSSHIGSGFPQS